ncbi:putative ferric-chelate reductase 1 [Takifugu rubripes]|uniref:putative ferric-chelate reductase 1 n=1 Tax=Takifugu rubripes TaxID=31033 RepID=UPI00114533D1|nr:putative ferric-chelate reductase 1 [Takifugu rubripes]XP_029687086.1 putative ferric-chelate reductase 1 [Takifugu rubripes]XP_029687087.1 putative ferric-chelate reductase 1 [Takifugu rubripes]
MERGRVLLFAALMIYTTCSTLKITRDGCGTTELCLASPDNCDPAGNDSCMFVSFEFVPPAPPNVSKVIFRLRGDSRFFITVGLTQNPSQGDTEFVTCLANSLMVGGVNYVREVLYVKRNNTDNSTKLDVSKTFESTQREVVGNILKCQFSWSGLNSSSTRGNNDLDFVVILGKGASGEFSPLSIDLTTGLLDLSNPRANIPTTTAPTSMVSTNTSMVPTAAARGPNQIHALLTLSALMLSVMLRG